MSWKKEILRTGNPEDLKKVLDVMTPGTVMVRDPIHTTSEVEFDPGTDMHKVLAYLYPEAKEDRRFLISMPVTRAKRVIDAKAGGPCDRCKTPVWLSPSSLRVEGAFTVICMECLEEGWARI